MADWLPSLAWNAAAATGVLVWGAAALAGLSRAWTALRERARVDVTDRWIVVTGCDSGLGQGLVAELIDRNARVIALCFTEQGAHAALTRGAALAPRVDLSDDDAVRAVAVEIERACGGALWGLVHNAGVVLPGFVEYVPHAYYQRVMDVNFFAPVLLTQRLLPCLRAASGRVVLVSSVDGLVSLPGNAPYDASKFAIEAYADALRCELSLWDLSVSVINPATLRTPLAMRFFDAHLHTWDAMDQADPQGSWKQVWPRAWAQEYATFNARRLNSIAQDPKHAVRDMVHALTARRPKLRYLSGTLAKTVFRALWLAPEGWSLAFKRSTIKPRPPSAKGGA
jgi:NAD(P)-dependent dehydrogenase (short-subunit alcohol dehydrogenase family)